MGWTRTFGVVLGIGVIMAAPAAVVAMEQSKPPTTVEPFPTTSTTVSDGPVYFPGPASEVMLTGEATCMSGGGWTVGWTASTPHVNAQVTAAMSDMKVAPIAATGEWPGNHMTVTYPSSNRVVKLWVTMQWPRDNPFPPGSGQSDGVVVVNPCGK